MKYRLMIVLILFTLTFSLEAEDEKKTIIINGKEFPLTEPMEYSVEGSLEINGIEYECGLEFTKPLKEWPKWNPFVEECPLSIHKAIKLAVVLQYS